MSNIIHILNKRLELFQPEDGLKTSTDTVLLAAACPIISGETLLDLGCGVGAAGLCVAKRVENIALTGIDIQADHIALAQDNARLNKVTAIFLTQDVRELTMEGFDHIICNPPYHDAGAHSRSPSQSKALAAGHEESSLQDWLDSANRLLRHGGCLTLIHRADQIHNVIKGLKNRFGALEIIPIWPKAGQDAGRVILRAIRNAKGPSTLHTGLIMHQDNGEYTSEAEKILREMRPIL